MKKLKHGLYSVLGRIYIPEELLGRDDLILHFSDTPATIYPALRMLIRKMKPKVIIHTGDLCDNVKLEYNENLMEDFRRDAMKIIRIMEFSPAEEIYIALGNHDDLREMQKMCTRSVILDYPRTLQIRGLDMSISHYHEDVLENPRDYNLYGHNLDRRSQKVRTRWFLNGVCGINVIESNTGRVHELRYPWGTDNYRYRRRKSGL